MRAAPPTGSGTPTTNQSVLAVTAMSTASSPAMSVGFRVTAPKSTPASSISQKRFTGMPGQRMRCGNFAVTAIERV